MLEKEGLENRPRVTGSDDGYAMFKLAGEMYGRLHDALGFGDLTMWFDGSGFTFRWGFRAKNQHYGTMYRVTFIDFKMHRDISVLTDQVSGDWKKKHRRVVEEHGDDID